MINYEVEYVLRPVSAPVRPGPKGPKLRTNRRARSSQPGGRARVYERSDGGGGGGGGGGYPRVTGGMVRSSSAHGVHSANSPVERPRTAPHRSPTRPHYKEEMYKQSQIVLRYIGHPDHRARDRNSRISRTGRQAPMPAYLDEITVLQQPRGSYTLEVFKGYLAVGDEFWFTSRRVEGFSFSLTIFVNKQCHVRLSACCESKRKVGSRLGQGLFQLVRVEEAEPCVR